MKELSIKTIITITIVLVAIVMTFAFYFDGRFDTLSNNSPLYDFEKYDCTKSYDKLIKLYSKPDIDLRITMVYLPHSIYNMPYSLIEFMDNRCYTTIESWAHQSDYELLIWKLDWQNWAYIEQIYNHEVDCSPNTRECIYGDLKN